jgi:hypothetical protein
MSKKIGPRIVLGTTLLACATAALIPAGSLAASDTKPHVSTGAATHLRGSTALLTGNVFPTGGETSYYFEYGPTTAYGSQTPTASVPAGTAKVPVGQPIAGLTPGVTYDFELFGVTGGKVVHGANRTFVAGGTPSKRLAFKLPKPSAPTVYGTPVLISGTLSGQGGANAPIALQASPYPYLEPFVNIGVPGTANAAGAFSFRVSNLLMSTQFRVVTLGTLPVYSPVVTEQVALNVALRVSQTRRKGYVRMYGVVTPAKTGAQIVFQLQKATRPFGSSESTTRYVTEATAVVKRAGKTFSRFSAIVEIRHAGRYRAFVKLPAKGPLASGTSNSIVIHQVASKTRGAKKKG